MPKNLTTWFMDDPLVRKRMSVIVRDHKGVIRLVCKGAEVTILPRCQSRYRVCQRKCCISTACVLYRYATFLLIHPVNHRVVEACPSCLKFPFL